MSRVVRLDQMTSRHFEISLERKGLVYESGQWALLVHDDRVTSRPFSFSSSPHDGDRVSFFFREMGDGFTKWLSTRKIGDEVHVGVPAGQFQPGVESNEIWVATGTGIAPFLSVLRGGRYKPHQLVYGVRNQADAYPLNQDEMPFLNWALGSRTFTPDSLEVYRQALSLDQNSHYFLCGVTPVVRGLVLWLKEMGIESRRIHTESYA